MIKKVLSWIVFVSLFAFVIIGFATKDKLNGYLSQTLIANSSPEIIHHGNRVVDSLFNYSATNSTYKITFLEFGAKGCTACRKMEKVMDDIRAEYPEEVNVVFLNILEPESQMLMRYYGIASIPTQVFLNNKGKEFYRHTGYIPSHELELLTEIRKLNN